MPLGNEPALQIKAGQSGHLYIANQARGLRKASGFQEPLGGLEGRDRVPQRLKQVPERLSDGIVVIDNANHARIQKLRPSPLYMHKRRFGSIAPTYRHLQPILWFRFYPSERWGAGLARVERLSPSISLPLLAEPADMPARPGGVQNGQFRSRPCSHAPPGCGTHIHSRKCCVAEYLARKAGCRLAGCEWLSHGRAR